MSPCPAPPSPSATAVSPREVEVVITDIRLSWASIWNIVIRFSVVAVLFNAITALVIYLIIEST